MSESSSTTTTPDILLKNLIEGFVTEYRSENGSFPDASTIQDIAYFGSSVVEEYAGDPVPGIGQVVSGSPTPPTAALNLDLNNPRTHDNPDDNTNVELYTIIGDAINEV